ncbi:AtpZ/AtpI family protein [Alkalilacustris brevis]|uniref:AtpZ/AtpI family protein n=1 Tax=Alkalilacustris brevis TaxID=2026338 RepID=UPI000E0D4356|nr:AtpZ/AtpI family protein [Alkalilacustris brevis]
MMDQGEQERLRKLGERIAAARGKSAEAGPRGRGYHSQGQFAWRMVTELVAGLVVGVGIGLGLDALFGTRPFLLLLFTLLGFAGGVMTMLRTARAMSDKRDEGDADSPAKQGEEDGRRG